MRLSGGVVRGIGGTLIGAFGLYIGGIAFGIYRGVVVAPEDSDSDSDSDEGSDSDSGSEVDEVPARNAETPSK